jgi:hypothetical protein
MPSRFPAPTVLGTAAVWVSAFGRAAARIWNGTVLCALIVILIMRIAVAAIASNPGRWTIAAIGLAATIPVGAFEYQLHYAGWTVAPAARTTNGGAEDFASFNQWKRSIEQTLKEAEAREHRDRARPDNAGEATTLGDILQEEAVAAATGREVAKLEANSLYQKNESNAASDTEKAAATEVNEDRPAQTTKEPEPLSRSPVIDNGGAVPTDGEVVTPRRPSGHAWGRGHWRGRHYGWRYYRMTGVARAFPFALSVR